MRIRGTRTRRQAFGIAVAIAPKPGERSHDPGLRGQCTRSEPVAQAAGAAARCQPSRGVEPWGGASRATLERQRAAYDRQGSSSRTGARGRRPRPRRVGRDGAAAPRRSKLERANTSSTIARPSRARTRRVWRSWSPHSRDDVVVAPAGETTGSVNSSTAWALARPPPTREIGRAHV